ncbi:MAG: glutamate synthase large subunit, partial [Pseudomonadota bacterium]
TAEGTIGRLEAELAQSGWQPIARRDVPTDDAILGVHAGATRPRIVQVFLAPPAKLQDPEAERSLFVARRRYERRYGYNQLTIVSLSQHNVCYKGLTLPANLAKFYLDLRDPEMAAAIAVFHQRFSTNTTPQWRLAQPFRLLAHNGEINTIAGNRAWAKARSSRFFSPHFHDVLDIVPDFREGESDSASLDQMLEFLVQGGLSLPLALRVLMPPAWQNVPGIDADLRAFYQYYSLNMEPWDGPAGVVITDGRLAACAADRNGLRPARYAISASGRIVLASEAGVVPIEASEIIEKGRLGPGDMLVVDTVQGRVETTREIDDALKKSSPFQSWLRERADHLEPLLRSPQLVEDPFTRDELDYLERLFELSFEERHQVLRVLAEAGKEAVGSMGDDTPLAVLSQRRRPVYDYLRQQFAQVTNPPIDPLRESIVMSLEINFGPESNVFAGAGGQASRIVSESPVLSEAKFRELEAPQALGMYSAHVRLMMLEGESLPESLDRIAGAAVARVAAGADLLILDDRPSDRGVVPVHALLGVGCVHQALARAGIRCKVNVVVATATARDPHQIACLLGCGATAVFPYLAYQSLAGMAERGELEAPGGDIGLLGRAFRKGINFGLYKIMSKMGISTMWSYLGSRLFEVTGLDHAVYEKCFEGAADAGISGATFAMLEGDARAAHAEALEMAGTAPIGGVYRFIRGGESHAWNPGVVQSLQRAVTDGYQEDYDEYRDAVNGRAPLAIRDLLGIRSDHDPIEVDAVEARESILPRFESAGMSLGALSPEAHESLAIAMNRIGGRSNSGEGGEDPARNGTERASKIRQVASGRFGVTAPYLRAAQVIQIKMAQGAKPGEGGQLPGHKVDGLIARLRYARPGVGLISPPPHHDIYSIEDLAQLIYDLKEVNPQALVSVKLVARRGVGTIAAGVAKAHADMITISGYDGGTGASPLTSIKHAGGPWELGIAETQQALRANGLRGRVRLQVDGGLKTGLDVIKAAALGAESFGFGTGPMVALGCKYLRICHLNNCATGVATQDKTLREDHYHGIPGRVVRYFEFVADEVRELLAGLGVEKIEDIIGRPEYLERLPGLTDRHRALDLEPLLAYPEMPEDAPRFCVEPRNRRLDRGELATRIAEETEPVIQQGRSGIFRYHVTNSDRSIGARLAGRLADLERPLDPPLRLQLSGSAGQSLGAWCMPGMDIEVVGEGNDYVGKGMHGGTIVLRPPAESSFDAHQAPIAGNTCLYGATGGRMFAAGRVGERFGVRNSGAVAVVEGIGDHGCEYMTDGVVAVLGSTGRNFGAGMTGGFAYVLDLERRFVDLYNHELIDIHRIATEAMEAHVYYLRELVREHVERTDSAWAREVLSRLREYLPLFWLVKPRAAEIEDLLENLTRAA